ncbi:MULTISPECIES: transglutaminase-like domain-containing protein [unclassified Clostridium]|uniref:transglutaminase-like domain-containing protein n=1 Tax=unclassified Clostridium TaxID=2614128 RepID=UPI00029831AC|nr:MULTISPECIES: transglutaminase-like domain-containing protein [unclassified Clostridium]EKQ56243.1 MAG: transglutaminase-like enzyme, putative cysteine protease [Clostridium sp. Maddingley MBC34-26]
MKENKFLPVITGIISGCIQISLVIGLLVLPAILSNSKVINSFSENGLKQENSSNESSKNIITKFFNNKSSKQIVIYNGITIDEGIKSNEDIDNKAIELTKNATSDRERAKILYTWVGSNIKYDDDKANKVLYEKDYRQMPESGAITAFENRSGICFDKACLYVAMSRSINLKVRLIGGQAYDGRQYVGHAWNQVYLNDENIWINVDPTFYDGGNYFDSNLFNKHKVEEIVGEW